MRKTVSKKHLLVCMGLSAALIMLICFLFHDPITRGVERLKYCLSFRDEIEFCDSIDSDGVLFESVRQFEDEYIQFVYEVNEQTSWEEVRSVVDKCRDYCMNRYMDGTIWQIVFSDDISYDTPVGMPIIILTNQLGISGEVSQDRTCMYMCRLSLESSWALSHIEGSCFDCVNELILAGSFDDLTPFENWTGLELCAYSKPACFFTYKILPRVRGITENEWNDMCSAMNISVRFLEYDECQITELKLGTTFV